MTAVGLAVLLKIKAFEAHMTALLTHASVVAFPLLDFSGCYRVAAIVAQMLRNCIVENETVRNA